MASGPSAARKPLVSGNWKMHHDHFETIRWLQEFGYQMTADDFEAVDVSVHPPFTALRPLQTVSETDGVPIAVGAQHCHWETQGAFTGEVSPAMLAKLHVRYVIAGHSERRTLFAETDADVNRRVRAILAAGMTPILCVGESLEQRDEGVTEQVVTTQVQEGLVDVPAAQVGGLVIAYEPVWAIGTGRTATADDAQTVCAAIRSVVGERFGAEAASSVRVQYGGSVKADNAAELLGQPDIDGALVGGASLDPEQFARIVQAARPGS